MKKSKKIILEIIESKGRANLADIESEVDRLKFDEPFVFEAFTGCSIGDALDDMVAEGLLEKDIPKWGIPIYSLKSR